MDRLRALDQIAYIRFASVYQSFEDLEDSQARGRHPVCRARRARSRSTCARSTPRAVATHERPVRPRHPRGARGRRVRIDPYDPATSSRRRSTSTSTAISASSATTATPYIDVRDAAAGPHRAADGRGRRAVHPPSRRIRPRPDARMGRAARRSRRQARRTRRWPSTPRSRLRSVADDGRSRARRSRLRRDGRADADRRRDAADARIARAARSCSRTGQRSSPTRSHQWVTIDKRGRDARTIAIVGPDDRRDRPDPPSQWRDEPPRSARRSRPVPSRGSTCRSSPTPSARGSATARRPRPRSPRVDPEILEQISGDGFTVQPLRVCAAPVPDRRRPGTRAMPRPAGTRETARSRAACGPRPDGRASSSRGHTSRPASASGWLCCRASWTPMDTLTMSPGAANSRASTKASPTRSSSWRRAWGSGRSRPSVERR